jgi:hypothetical protein
MATDTPETLMTRSLLEVFNQRDPHKRATVIGEIYDPGIVFYEAEGAVTGSEALQERVQQLLDGAPGFIFVPVGKPAVNHDIGRQPWSFGPAGAPPVVFGTDIARIVGDRIAALYVFVEPPTS